MYHEMTCNGSLSSQNFPCRTFDVHFRIRTPRSIGVFANVKDGMEEIQVKLLRQTVATML